MERKKEKRVCVCVCKCVVSYEKNARLTVDALPRCYQLLQDATNCCGDYFISQRKSNTAAGEGGESVCGSKLPPSILRRSLVMSRTICCSAAHDVGDPWDGPPLSAATRFHSLGFGLCAQEREGKKGLLSVPTSLCGPLQTGAARKASSFIDQASPFCVRRKVSSGERPSVALYGNRSW